MTSCATVFCGSKAKVTFDSDIAEKATLTIDGRKYTNVTFPYTTKIGHQSAGHTRMGNRRCDRSHDQTGIQILSD